MASGGTGTLFVVATPLGNLEDITLRAVRILREADIVAAEDTRHSRKLLDHFGIRARLFSYYDEVETQKAPTLVRELRQGRSVALISDAGTPCIADPGYRLVRAAVEAGVRVEVVPGPSAVIAALSVSGLPTDRFCFEGFVPAKAGARERYFRDLAGETRTLVFYETARRLEETLRCMQSALGSRPLVIGRELTKLHEEIRRGSTGEILEGIAASATPPRGEFVIVCGGATAPAPTMSEEEIAAAVAALRREGMSLKRAAQQLAEELGLARNEVYRIGLTSR